MHVQVLRDVSFNGETQTIDAGLLFGQETFFFLRNNHLDCISARALRSYTPSERPIRNTRHSVDESFAILRRFLRKTDNGENINTPISWDECLARLCGLP